VLVAGAPNLSNSNHRRLRHSELNDSVGAVWPTRSAGPPRLRWMARQLFRRVRRPLVTPLGRGWRERLVRGEACCRRRR
jgi:hypothetical protein